MAIQVDQRIAKCARCGKMLHSKADVLTVTALDGASVLLCSEICKQEYVAIAKGVAAQR